VIKLKEQRVYFMSERKKIGFDIGACLGESISKFDGFDEIYCFEPSPYAYDNLVKVIENDSRIKCFQLAISDENGEKDFYYHDHYGYSSLLEIDQSSEFAKKCHQDDPGFDYVMAVIKVQTKRLDTFMKENNIEHIDFIKIDTQGNDLNVIKSLGNMIDKVDTIELEVQLKPLYKGTPLKEEVINFMKSKGFILGSEKANSIELVDYEHVLKFKRDETNNFNWGETDLEHINLFSRENFINRTYEKHYKVKKDDIVLDLGANYGSFSFSIKESQPKHIYCVEPSNRIFNILQDNLKNIPTTCINKAINDDDSDNKIIESEYRVYNHEGDRYSTIKFKTLLEKHDIKTIDLLKFDCEGGEFHIFNKENLEIIKNRVKNIAGEYHITYHSNSVENFINFRNYYLSELEGTDKIHVYDRDGNDLTDKIFDDNYVQSFKEFWDNYNPYKGQFMVYANFEDYQKDIQTKSIPVIGVPVVNSSYWVSRLLMSIDYPVDNFVIINNNGRGELDDELNNLSKIRHKYVKNIKVCHLPANIGCGGAWNLIIKCYMMAPYWIIVNDDVAFGSGFLQEMVSVAESDSAIGMIHGHSGDFGVGSWDLFLIRDHIIKEFGLFDENLYPAYCEDADYIMRFQHRPIKKVMSLNSNYYHGDGDKTQYYETGSQTKKTDPSLNQKLSVVNELNIEYLTEKWGTGWRTCNPEVVPFRDKEQKISTTSYDLEFVRQKHLGF